MIHLSKLKNAESADRYENRLTQANSHQNVKQIDLYLYVQETGVARQQQDCCSGNEASTETTTHAQKYLHRSQGHQTVAIKCL